MHGFLNFQLKACGSRDELKQLSEQRERQFSECLDNNNNHKGHNFLDCDWFKRLQFSTNSLAKLLSDSLLLDSLLLNSLLSDSLLLDSLLSDSLLLDSLLLDSSLSDSSMSQSHSKL